MFISWNCIFFFPGCTVVSWEIADIGAERNVCLYISWASLQYGRKWNRFKSDFRSGNLFQHHFAANHILCRLLTQAGKLFMTFFSSNRVCSPLTLCVSVYGN